MAIVSRGDWKFPFTPLKKTRLGVTRNRTGSHRNPISRHEGWKVGLPMTAALNHPPMATEGRVPAKLAPVNSNEGESVRR